MNHWACIHVNELINYSNMCNVCYVCGVNINKIPQDCGDIEMAVATGGFKIIFNVKQYNKILENFNLSLISVLDEIPNYIPPMSGADKSILDKIEYLSNTIDYSYVHRLFESFHPKHWVSEIIPLPDKCVQCELRYSLINYINVITKNSICDRCYFNGISKSQDSKHLTINVYVVEMNFMGFVIIIL